MWIDAHCHLAAAAFADDIDAVLDRSRACGVNAWVQGGIEPHEWQRQVQLAQRLGDSVSMAFGLHPWWVSAATDKQVEQALVQLAASLSAAVLLGEAGLDRSVRGLDEAGFMRQKLAFTQQLNLASINKKPLVLHIVRAHREAAAMIAAAGGAPSGGLVHAFNGGPDDAKRYLELGLHLSVNGAVARPGFKKLKAALRIIPRDYLLVETDAPDGPLDGQRREPADLLPIANAIGLHLEIDPHDILNRSAAALRQLLGKVS